MLALLRTRKAQPMLLETLESMISIASLTPSIIFLCYSEISFIVYGLNYYFVLITGTVDRFFLLKTPPCNSSDVAWFSIFAVPFVPLGKYFALFVLPTVFYSDILASFKLLILAVFLDY